MAVGVLTDRWREFLRNYEEEVWQVVSAAEIARDYEETRGDFYATLAAEAAEAGDYERVRMYIESLEY